MPESLAYTYTTQAEMEKVVGKATFMNLVDPDGDRYEDTTIVDGLCYDATDEMNFFCAHRYDPEDMANNAWVRRTASWLGCYFATALGGNPEHFQAQAERVLQRLQLIHDGSHQIPRLALRADLTPSMSNLRIEPWHSDSPVRVTATDIVGGSYSEQFRSSRFIGMVAGIK